MSSLDYKKMAVITDILDIQNDINALEEYLHYVNNAKLQVMFDKFKERVGINTALEYLTIMIDLCGFNINKELLEGLLNDDDLVEFVSKSKNQEGIISKLKMVLVEDSFASKENEEEVDLSDLAEEATKEMNTEDAARYGNSPLYTPEEEKEVFRKYDELRTKLEVYLESRMHIPEVAAFKNYIENRCVEAIDGVDRSKTKDSFIVKSIMALYGTPKLPKDQPMVDLMKDQNIVDIIEEMREIRDDIYFHNRRLAISIAKKYTDRGVPLDDLIQEGSIGLNKAIDKFDPKKGFRFSTFAVNWIVQAVTRALANDGSVIRIPVHLSDIINKVKRAERALRIDDMVDEPTADEIFKKCKELNIDLSLEQVKKALRVNLISNPISTNKPIGEDKDMEFGDTLTSNSIEAPEDYATYQGLHSKYVEAISAVSNGKLHKTRNESVIREYMFMKVTFEKKDGNSIFIIFSPSEYNRYMKNYSAPDGRARYEEFIKRYGINPSDFTGKVIREKITFTKDERQALIYSIRNGEISLFAKMFIAGRNFNNVLFDDDENNKEYTLQKVGYLFEVTRERIRQIESKCERKVQRGCHSWNKESESVEKLIPDYVIKHFYVGDPLKINVYAALNIVRRNEYKGIVSKDGIVSVDEDGNILPVKPGTTSIILRNLATGDRKELKIVVHELNEKRDSDPITDFLNKKLQEKTLELLPDNKKDNQ